MPFWKWISRDKRIKSAVLHQIQISSDRDGVRYTAKISFYSYLALNTFYAYYINKNFLIVNSLLKLILLILIFFA